MRELSKREYGAIQNLLAEHLIQVGKKATIMQVHPRIQREFGVNLSLFCMEHELELKVLANGPYGIAVYCRPPGEEWKG